MKIRWGIISPSVDLSKKIEKKMLADNTKFDDSPLERRVGKSEEAHVTLVAHPKACVYLII
jgi:hypothetical protein